MSTKTHIRINSETLFALLRAADAALDQPVGVFCAYAELDVDEWVEDVELLERVLRRMRPSHAPSSWMLTPFVWETDAEGVEVHV